MLDFEDIIEDPGLNGRFKVSLAEALARSMNSSEWKKFAIRWSLGTQITDHPRFLRSLAWGDDDHEGLVLDLVEYISDHRPDAVADLMGRKEVKRAFKQVDPELLDIIESDGDPVVTALSHSLDEVKAVRDVVDLKPYIERIAASLPSDPHQAIGATKDLLESAMRTILHERGQNDIEQHDFPKLVSVCFAALKLESNTPPSNKADALVRKINAQAKKMILAANELRNIAGTGHGRVIGNENSLSAEDARV